ncbi:MAG: nitrate reductase associated protein [Hyphomicrobiaceae bacterium]
MRRQLILVLGTGDVASAVAHRLFCEGHFPVCQDGEQPPHSRRGMAFADALFDGTARLDGITATRVDDLDALVTAFAHHDVVPVTSLDVAQLIEAIRPGVVIDARMRKRRKPEPLVAAAPLTIGLGPNFVAGDTVDLAVETSWGDDLGRVVDRGPTRSLAGEPRAIDGVGRERFVYAPTAGVLRTPHHIGAMVQAGMTVATIGDVVLQAPITGNIRGLTRDGVRVETGAKVVEISPQGASATIFGLGERPKAIAAGVSRAVAGRPNEPQVFRFEAQFLPALDCMPMCLRFKLDAIAVKVSLAEWQGLTPTCRALFFELPATTAEQIRRYTALLAHFIPHLGERRTAQTDACDKPQSWCDQTQVAAEVVGAAVSRQVAPPSLRQWVGLTPLQRFALFKLATNKRGIHSNFVPAMREFGIV